MKKTIKKIISIALLSCLMISLLSACSSKMLTGDDSIKVQSITYSHGNSTTTLTSSYYFEYTKEEVDVTEYENATEKIEYDYDSGIITIDGFARIKIIGDRNETYERTTNQLKELVGKTCYYMNDWTKRCYKITYTDLHLSYLNVKFINDDTFEVSY